MKIGLKGGSCLKEEYTYYSLARAGLQSLAYQENKNKLDALLDKRLSLIKEALENTDKLHNCSLVGEDKFGAHPMVCYCGGCEIPICEGNK